MIMVIEKRKYRCPQCDCEGVTCEVVEIKKAGKKRLVCDYHGCDVEDVEG